MIVLLALTASAAAPECHGVPVQGMVDRYAALIRKQDSASIAHLFGEDGTVDNPGAPPLRGEKAIRTFLSSFHGAVVKSEAMTVSGVRADGPGWRLEGRFHQTGRTPEGKDYDVAGSFDSTWTCTAQGWRVKRVATGK